MFCGVVFCSLRRDERLSFGSVDFGDFGGEIVELGRGDGGATVCGMLCCSVFFLLTAKGQGFGLLDFGIFGGLRWELGRDEGVASVFVLFCFVFVIRDERLSFGVLDDL